MYHLDTGHTGRTGFHPRPSPPRTAASASKKHGRRHTLTKAQALGLLALVMTVASIGITVCLVGLGALDWHNPTVTHASHSAPDSAVDRRAERREQRLANRREAPPEDETTILTMLEAIQHPLTAHAVRFQFVLTDIPAPREIPPEMADPFNGAPRDGPKVSLAAMPALPACDLDPKDPSSALLEFSAKIVAPGSPQLAIVEGVIRNILSGRVDESPVARLRNRHILELGLSELSGLESQLAFDVETGALYVADATSWEMPVPPQPIAMASLAKGCLERVTWLRTVGRDPVLAFDEPASIATASVVYLGT